MTMSKRVTLGILTLLATAVLAASAWGNAADMNVRQFRQHDQRARIYMVLGAMSVTNSVALVCPAPVTVAEIEAALMVRELQLDKTWVQAMIELMGERGCTVSSGEKPNA